MKSQISEIDFDSICTVAQEAGKKILEIQSSKIEKFVKDDGSFVTEADLASDKIIFEGLNEISNIPILSEEKLVSLEDRKEWELYWLVDPLDGTKDFIHQTGDYTVNIALIFNGEPIWGVIYVPEKNQTFYGGKDFGTFLDGKKIKSRPFGEEIVALESHFHSTELNVDFNRRFDIKKNLKVGSSLKFCSIACGKADLYARLGPTMEWDIAAGCAILQGAGGDVLTWPELKPVSFNKEDLRNPYFVAVSGPEILQYLISGSE